MSFDVDRSSVLESFDSFRSLLDDEFDELLDPPGSPIGEEGEAEGEGKGVDGDSKLAEREGTEKRSKNVDDLNEFVERV